MGCTASKRAHDRSAAESPTGKINLDELKSSESQTIDTAMILDSQDDEEFELHNTPKSDNWNGKLSVDKATTNVTDSSQKEYVKPSPKSALRIRNGSYERESSMGVYVDVLSPFREISAIARNEPEIVPARSTFVEFDSKSETSSKRQRVKIFDDSMSGKRAIENRRTRQTYGHLVNVESEIERILQKSDHDLDEKGPYNLSARNSQTPTSHSRGLHLLLDALKKKIAVEYARNSNEEEEGCSEWPRDIRAEIGAVKSDSTIAKPSILSTGTSLVHQTEADDSALRAEANAEQDGESSVNCSRAGPSNFHTQLISICEAPVGIVRRVSVLPEQGRFEVIPALRHVRGADALPTLMVTAPAIVTATVASMKLSKKPAIPPAVAVREQVNVENSVGCVGSSPVKSGVFVGLDDFADSDEAEDEKNLESVVETSSIDESQSVRDRGPHPETEVAENAADGFPAASQRSCAMPAIAIA